MVTDDPYAKAASVGWPPNVLLAGILQGGSASIHIASDFWNSAAFVDLDQSAGTSDSARETASAESVVTDHETPARVTKVNFGTWQSWCANTTGEPPQQLGEWFAQLREAGYPITTQEEHLCLRYIGACMQWGASEDTALDDVIVSLLAIRASSLGRAEELSSSLGSFRDVPERSERSERVDSSIAAAKRALL